MKKKIISLILILCLLFPTFIFAKEKIDISKKSKLEIDYYYKYNNTNILLKNAKFDLYFIAELDEDGNYTLIDKYNDYNLDMESSSLATTIRSFIIRDEILPDYSKNTNNNGSLIFNDLKVGMYLIIPDKLSQDTFTYMSKEYIITIPYYNEDDKVWDYSLISIPKVEREKEIPEEEKYISKKIMVSWKDNENVSLKRPLQIKVELYQDDILYDEVLLSEENNWQHTWEKLLAFNKEGIKIKYSVVQGDIDYYSVSLNEESGVFSIVNTYKEKTKPEEKLPQTGVLWWPVPILFILGLLCIKFGYKLCRKEK